MTCVITMIYINTMLGSDTYESGTHFIYKFKGIKRKLCSYYKHIGVLALIMSSILLTLYETHLEKQRRSG